MTATCSVRLSVLQRREAGRYPQRFRLDIVRSRRERFTHLVLPPGSAGGSSAATMSWQSRRPRTAARRWLCINYCAPERTRTLHRRKDRAVRVAGSGSKLARCRTGHGRVYAATKRTDCLRTKGIPATMSAPRCVATVVRTSGHPEGRSRSKGRRRVGQGDISPYNKSLEQTPQGPPGTVGEASGDCGSGSKRRRSSTLCYTRLVPVPVESGLLAKRVRRCDSRKTTSTVPRSLTSHLRRTSPVARRQPLTRVRRWRTFVHAICGEAADCARSGGEQRPRVSAAGCASSTTGTLQARRCICYSPIPRISKATYSNP